MSITSEIVVRKVIFKVHIPVQQDEQGRVGLRARWAIAQGPRLSRGSQKEKIVRKERETAYENLLSRDIGAPKIY